MQIVCGLSSQQIYESMLQDSNYRKYDVVVVVLAYNGTTELD